MSGQACFECRQVESGQVDQHANLTVVTLFGKNNTVPMK